ncbi:MAG: gfo/Idh/MocA family oxidoreductase, partial [Bacteroidetes bacterium]|nr:gfo/Idh/MocA family oxidoreductase [Bacteroidota bacterium]
KKVEVDFSRGGHGGGDERLHDKIFKNPDAPDPLKHTAGIRDGAMSILIGIAARKSIESGEPIKIASLTDLEPRAKRI